MNTFAYPQSRIALFAERSLFSKMLIVFLGAVLLTLGSQVSIPWQPIPLTLQSSLVILLGLSYGSRLAAASVSLYLIAGMLGLPVFADWSSGLAILFGPTGGYLFGFLIAAVLSGYLMEKGCAKYFLSTLAVGLFGTAIIFLCGWLMLSHFIGMEKAYLLGVKVFLITESVKLFVVSWVAKRQWRN